MKQATRLITTLPLLFAFGALTSCERDEPASVSSSEKETVDPNALELVFSYGSEKQNWLEKVTEDYHATKPVSSTGKPVRIRLMAMGSGECVDTLLDGSVKAHLTSPASAAFIKLGNVKWRVKTGKDLVAKTENLVLSPVVIAMWKPMAETLGWGQKPVGWSDILSMATEPTGWAARGNPQWGGFRFGHTHPEFSNSGLISVFAEVYAATGKLGGLTTEDVAKPETALALQKIESSVVHYGSSTGFFGKKMFANGPSYLSAAVLYESNVIESYAQVPPTTLPVVAIYPKEGTFWSDHPAGVVEADWVTEEHRAAAQAYLEFLLDEQQQKEAMTFGFRPALAEIPLTSPFDAAHGVDPGQPQTTLEVPSVETMDAILQLWRVNKKKSSITLVMDTSGSMQENGRIENAREGAVALIEKLQDADEFRLMPFNEAVFPAKPSEALAASRSQATRAAGSLIASGGTALYDAIAAAYRDKLEEMKSNPGRIHAIVVLTDGADTNSQTSLADLLSMIRSDNEMKTIRIFTIGYDSGAQTQILKDIADATQGKYYQGDPGTIREIFRDISTFF
jgi:Ca-activated chloride channel homolog